MITKDITNIHKCSTERIATVLGVSTSQARRYKRGESGLSNSQALLLEDILGLNPRAFDAIRLCYNNKLEK